MENMKGKTVVITGGSTGIGLATAQVLAKRGARLILFSRSARDLDAASESISSDQVTTVAGDVTIESDLDGLFEVAGKVDSLFINAGIAEFRALPDADLAHFERLFATNVRGAYLTMRHAEKRLARGSSILFTTSVASTIGAPLCSIYAATKGALSAFARNLGAELLERGIRVNALAPGPTETPIQGKSPLSEEEIAKIAPYVMSRMRMGRLATAQEVGEMAAFLLSPSSSFVTGQEIFVDGGMSGL